LIQAEATGRLPIFVGELRKVPAFLRRDFLVAWSYRMSFVMDWLSLVVQTGLFYFVGKMVDGSKLPVYGGTRATYLEFVAIGIAVGGFVAVALVRVATGIRSEQMMGTLESLLMTPTAPSTIQLGAVAYDLVYVPIRTAAFLVIVTLAFGLDLQASGIFPALVTLLFFIPFAWGLGVIAAAAILTFRRGDGVVGFGTMVMALASGAYIPLSVLPHWISQLADVNPMAIAVQGMRDALLGGTGWAHVGSDVLMLAPMSAVSLGIGVLLFRVALRRERRKGTLGQY
jgi:ABC-2 type transport system permease protein